MATGGPGAVQGRTTRQASFEAISASKAGVVIGQHMQTTTDTIPVTTFRRDFTPTWQLHKAVPLSETYQKLLGSL